MQILLVSPGWVLGGLLVCFAAWTLLRGPRMFGGLAQMKSRQREIELRRKALADQAVELSQSRIDDAPKLQRPHPVL